MPGRLEGQVALISGSSQGFGRGILETFLREGALIVGMDLQAVDGPVAGFPEHLAYQIKANVAEEQTWVHAVFLSSALLLPCSDCENSSKPASKDTTDPPPSSSTTQAGPIPTSPVSKSQPTNSTACSTSTYAASTSPQRFSSPR